MRVHRDINNLPLFKNAVITIGTFDGVHTGHLKIIQQLKQEAAECYGETVIITFHPHPRMVIDKSPGSKEHQSPGIKLLNTLSEKITLLETQGINHLVIVPFTKEFSEQSAKDYIGEFLVQKFHPHTIIIGYDHRFGKNREGDYKLLENFRNEYQYRVKEIPQHVLNDVTISSTKIRHALAEGAIQTAQAALGYTYFFEGTVVAGNQLGRTLGYPTANIKIDDENKLVPGNGVYAVEIAILPTGNLLSKSPEQQRWKGMMNIGIRPTVGGVERVIEINIFDFDDDIYHRKVTVFIKGFLRHEVKFNGLEELKDQLSKDKQDAEKALHSS